MQIPNNNDENQGATYEQEDGNKQEQQSLVAISNTILSKINDIESHLNPSDDVINSREACSLLKVKPQQLYRLCREKKIPFYKPFGKSLYFSRSQIMELIRPSDP